MSASVRIFFDPDFQNHIDVVELQEVLAPHDSTDLVEGEPAVIYGKNTGTTALRHFSIHVEGDGAQNVQLARDEGGEPGVWAAPGHSVLIQKETLFPDEGFSFWARGVFNPGDAEQQLPFDVVFKGVSIG